jgi:hypothetical protein
MALDDVALELRFVGGKAHPRVEAAQRVSGTVRYGLGPALAAHAAIIYRDVWPGIDVTFHGHGGQLKYEFHVAPGADPGDIALTYRGADRLTLNADGAPAITTPRGTLHDERPISHQGGVPVASGYAMRGATYGFALPAGYDRTRPLVIDPGLAYSTFLGSTGEEGSSEIAADSQGRRLSHGQHDLDRLPHDSRRVRSGAEWTA